MEKKIIKTKEEILFNLYQLKIKINNDDIHKSQHEYGGGGLIITKDTSWTGNPGTLVIYTKFSKEITWLIFELQGLNFFAPDLGIIVDLYNTNRCSLKSTLNAMVQFCEDSLNRS